MNDREPIRVDTDTDNWIDKADEASGDYINSVSGDMATPGLSHAENIRSNLWDIGEADGASIAGACAGVGATLVDFAGKIGSMGDASSALQAVVSMGFDIIVALVQPLEDLLHQVSGDPGAMRDRIDLWQSISEALTDLSSELSSVVPELAEWSTNDGVSAQEKLDELAAGMNAIAQSSGGIQQLMGLAQGAAELIKEAIKWVISWLIAKAIEIAVPSAAAAVVTFGSSIAAGIAKIVARGAQAVLKAVGFTTEMTNIAMRFASICITISGSQAKGMAANIATTLAGIGASAAQTAAAPAISNLTNSSGDDVATSSIAEGGIIVADLDQAAAGENRIRPLAEDAQHIADVADDTVHGDMTWGLCAIYFEGKYKEVAGEVAEEIRLCDQALSGSADRIKDSIDDWNNVDDELKSVFDDLDASIED